MPHGPSIVALNVGNTRGQIGVFRAGVLQSFERLAHADGTSAIVEAVLRGWSTLEETDAGAVVVASVHDGVADRLVSAVRDQLSRQVYRVGVDLPVPIGQRLDPETITGVDRLLNAAAAFDVLQQACVVVDAGTAVTVDFVDGEGTFHGGAIAPGPGMQLRALHEHTSALPEIEFTVPDPGEPFGRSTGQAMLRGAYHGARGLVRSLVEAYAEHYGAFPPVVATGGDAEALFGDDDLIDRIVPELTLHGIGVAARHALAARGDDDER